MGAAGWSRGAQHKIFIAFGMILKPYFESFLGTDLTFPLFFGLVSRSLFVPIFDSKLKRLGVLEPGSRMDCIANTNFSQKSFFMDFGMYFCRFLEALGAVFLVSPPLETCMKIDGFLVV